MNEAWEREQKYKFFKPRRYSGWIAHTLISLVNLHSSDASYDTKQTIVDDAIWDYIDNTSKLKVLIIQIGILGTNSLET